MRPGRCALPGSASVDALVELAKRSRTARPGGLRPRPLLTVLVGADTVKGVCELAKRDGDCPRSGRAVAVGSRSGAGRVRRSRPSDLGVPQANVHGAGALRRGRSKCETGAVSTPPGATNRPTAATSTTSSPTATAVKPHNTTVASAAGRTTATNSFATRTRRIRPTTSRQLAPTRTNPTSSTDRAPPDNHHAPLPRPLE